jgi:hypothetical protein
MSRIAPRRLPSKDAPFYLVTDYGYRYTLTSLAEVFDRLIRDRVVLDTVEGAPALVIPARGWRRYGMAGLGLLDSEERPVDLAWLGPLYARHLAALHDRRAVTPGFRQGSVEGVSKWRGGRSMFRHPHTTATLRQVAGRVTEDLEPDWRGRIKSLPTSYDDIYARPSRSWKRHRRHQWKGAF